MVAGCTGAAPPSLTPDSPASVTGGAPNSPMPENTSLSVVTTSNIVGDWVKNVGGKRVDVFSLLPVNADPHTFQPGARDVTRVANADLVISVGLTLEGAWFQELVNNAAADSGKLVILGDIVDPIEFAEPGDRDDDENDHGAFDPHFWFDPLRVKLVVTDIASRMSVLDSEGAETYRANARAYNAQLDELDMWIKEQVESVPPERRMLVTSHESLGYLVDRYGFELIGSVIRGGSTEREPSAQELAELVELIKETGAPAIFSETTVSDRFSQRLAEETGAQIVSGIYTGSLGEAGSGAETYIELMRMNVTTIVEALR